MRADNSRHLVAATQRRSLSARQRAQAVLEELIESTQAVTVASFVRSAQVSRSWLYTQPDLLDQLRQAGQKVPGRVHRVDTGASDASLLGRLEVAQERIASLVQDNRKLKEQLAAAYGYVRERNGDLTSMHNSVVPPDTRNGHHAYTDSEKD